jgi:hypothetical protein
MMACCNAVEEGIMRECLWDDMTNFPCSFALALSVLTEQFDVVHFVQIKIASNLQFSHILFVFPTFARSLLLDLHTPTIHIGITHQHVPSIQKYATSQPPFLRDLFRLLRAHPPIFAKPL